MHEFVADCAARGLAVNSTGGVAHGRYVPFLPVLALYRDYFGIAERDAPEVARERIEATMLALDPAFAADLPLLFEFLGVPDPERPLAPPDPEARQRRLLDGDDDVPSRRAAVTRRRCWCVEDLHWIDDASAAFLERARRGGRRHPDPARRHLPAGVRGRLDERRAARPSSSLGPLDADATDDLLTGLLGRDRSLDGLAALIEARTGGNPFFIEEIVQALAENGHLAGTRGAYRLAAELDGLVLPPTVQAGLAARIDRLPAREKALVQTMSVIGNEIPGPLLSEVSDLGASQLAEAVDVLAARPVGHPTAARAAAASTCSSTR